MLTKMKFILAIATYCTDFTLTKLFYFAKSDYNAGQGYQKIKNLFPQRISRDTITFSNLSNIHQSIMFKLLLLTDYYN